MKLPTLTLTGVSTAESFHFRGDCSMGWAIVTINDATHELSIQSDWGSWSYRWSGAGMPKIGEGADERRMLLSEFMQVPRSELSYFADKLWPGGGYGGQRFSHELTIAAFRTVIAERRLEDGRAWLRDARAYGADAANRYSHEGYGYGDRTRLTRDSARELWDALGEALDDSGIPESVFWERAWNVPNLAALGDSAYDCGRTDTDPAYLVLRDSILAAFVDGLRARTIERGAAIAAPAPG